MVSKIEYQEGFLKILLDSTLRVITQDSLVSSYFDVNKKILCKVMAELYPTIEVYEPDIGIAKTAKNEYYMFEGAGLGMRDLSGTVYNDCTALILRRLDDENPFMIRGIDFRTGYTCGVVEVELDRGFVRFRQKYYLVNQAKLLNDYRKDLAEGRVSKASKEMQADFIIAIKKNLKLDPLINIYNAYLGIYNKQIHMLASHGSRLVNTQLGVDLLCGLISAKNRLKVIEDKISENMKMACYLKTDCTDVPTINRVRNL